MLSFRSKTAIDKEDSFLSINEMDFGVEFEQELKNVKIDKDQISILKENCFMYLRNALASTRKCKNI